MAETSFDSVEGAHEYVGLLLADEDLLE